LKDPVFTVGLHIYGIRSYSVNMSTNCTIPLPTTVFLKMVPRVRNT